MHEYCCIPPPLEGGRGRTRYLEPRSTLSHFRCSRWAPLRRVSAYITHHRYLYGLRNAREERKCFRATAERDDDSSARASFLPGRNARCRCRLVWLQYTASIMVARRCRCRRRERISRAIATRQGQAVALPATLANQCRWPPRDDDAAAVNGVFSSLARTLTRHM